MIIKKWNPDKNGVGQGGFDELYPKTKASELYASDGATTIFDGDTKIKAAYLPDFVFGGMVFQDSLPTNSGYATIAGKLHTSWLAYGQDSLNGLIGKYYIAEGDFTLQLPSSSNVQTQGAGTEANPTRYYLYDSLAHELEEDTPASNDLDLEHGDWLVITDVTGSGTSSSDPYLVTFAVVNNTYQSATASSRGIVKLGSSTAQGTSANAVSSTTGRTYAIQNDGSGRLVVNVPWSDTNTTYAKATDSTLGLLKVSATANTQTLQSVSTNSSRQYAVQLDSNGVASVNVPWADTNTTYSTATSSTSGLIKLGSDTTQTVAAESVSSSTGRTYAVQLNSSDQAVVNVPWVNTNTTYSAGEGLTLTGTVFRETYPVYASTSEPTTSVENAIWFDL